MQKLLICVTKELAFKLEEKLRHHYDVQLDILDDHDDKNKDDTDVCKIKATLCSAPNENLRDILTMFQVNYELKAGRRSK
jgi:hypothetical protein